MTKHRPNGASGAFEASETAESAEIPHDYLPAAGRDAFLPFYDLLTVVFGVSRVHRALIEQARLADGQQVLEIGCGTGNLSLRAKRAQPGIQLIGSDPDPRALARAERKARGLGLDGMRFERAYAQRLPYPDATFDRVLSSLMLHHLDRDTKVATASEIRRVLRPGGSLHLVDFTGQADQEGHAGHGHGHGSHGLHNLHNLFSRRVIKSGHLEGYSDDGIRQMLNAAGLECSQVSSMSHSMMGQITYYQATRPR